VTLIYSTAYTYRRGYLAGAVTLLDDWLKRDRFVLLDVQDSYYFPQHISVLEVGSLEPHL
jgi:hypothetical protein